MLERTTTKINSGKELEAQRRRTLGWLPEKKTAQSFCCRRNKRNRYYMRGPKHAVKEEHEIQLYFVHAHSLTGFADGKKSKKEILALLMVLSQHSADSLCTKVLF